MSSVSPEDRLRLLLAAPVGCGFFLAAARAGLPVGLVVTPSVSLDLAAKVMNALHPWGDGVRAARTGVLDRAEEVADLAGEVVADDRSAWWWQSLPRATQVMLHGCEPIPPTPTEAARRFADYAQRPISGQFTATLFDGTSGLHAALANDVGDWEPRYPVMQEQIEVAPHARVLEVNSAEEWHALATGSGAQRHVPATLPEGVANDLSPDWVVVGQHWDAVHLTFGGLLAALFVAVHSPAGTTTLWTWESERTLWLRRPFVSRAALPPLSAKPPPGGVRYELRLGMNEVDNLAHGWLHPR